MTLVADPPVQSVGGGAPAPPPADRPFPVMALVSSMLTMLSIVLLVFVLEMVVIGGFRHLRTQHVLYDDFRTQLADGVAPTGQLDSGGKLLRPGAPVAVLSIPRLRLKEVVVEGTAAGQLMSGPGHRRDTALPGQAGTSIIMGRQATYGGPFRHLHDLRVGDEIAVVTGQGASLYKVTGTRHAGDRGVVADATTGRLTLITGDGTQYVPRDALRVDAQLTTSVLPSPARPLTAAALAKSEQPMRSDVSALLPLLLWSQLLLVVTILLAWLQVAWGRWQTWIVGVPVLTAVGFAVAHQVAKLLPNLM